MAAKNSLPHNSLRERLLPDLLTSELSAGEKVKYSLISLRFYVVKVTDG